eukprot:4411151-Pleurochrysis_carterae.AAC.1
MRTTRNRHVSYVMHVSVVNDFDDDYLTFAKIDAGILLCLHATAPSASDVLPPPKNYKGIQSRPDKEEWRADFNFGRGRTSDA